MTKFHIHKLYGYVDWSLWYLHMNESACIKLMFTCVCSVSCDGGCHVCGWTDRPATDGRIHVSLSAGAERLQTNPAGTDVWSYYLYEWNIMHEILYPTMQRAPLDLPFPVWQEAIATVISNTNDLVYVTRALNSVNEFQCLTAKKKRNLDSNYCTIVMLYFYFLLDKIKLFCWIRWSKKSRNSASATPWLIWTHWWVLIAKFSRKNVLPSSDWQLMCFSSQRPKFITANWWIFAKKWSFCTTRRPD